MWAEQLQRFFAANDVAVRFLHGQVFFVLGLAMGLQWRQRSRLELARGLPWVSAFGLCEALSIWGDLFVPLQAAYLDPAAVGALRSLQLFLRLVSMAALLGFGLQLIEPLVPRAMSAGVPITVAALGAAALVVQRLASPVPDLASAEALLRYTVGAPASLLVAFGLRRQAFKLVDPLGAGHHPRAECDRGDDCRLRPGVVALDVCRWIPFGKAQALRLCECLRVARGPFGHLREDEVGGAVHDAHHPGDALTDERLA